MIRILSRMARSSRDGFHGCFAGLRADKVEVQIVQHALYLGSVIGKYNYFKLIMMQLIADWNIEQAVVLCVPRKLFCRFFGNLEKFERPLLLEHADKPCLSARFLLVLEHGIGKQCEILCRQAGQLEGDFCPFQRKADNLVRRV